MLAGDVADQFQDQEGLADAGPAEQPDFTAAAEGHEQVDDLDAGLEQFLFRKLVGKRGRRPVDRPVVGGHDRSGIVDRLAEHVEQPARDRLPDRHLDGRAGRDRFGSPDQPVGRRKRDTAHDTGAALLHDLDDDGVRLGLDLDRLVDGRDLLLREANVDHRPDDLRYIS